MGTPEENQNYVEVLIAAVRDRPALWQTSLKEYKDRNLKRKLWDKQSQIASQTS